MKHFICKALQSLLALTWLGLVMCFLGTRMADAQSSGTWTAVANNPYDGFGTCMLLTDGTIMAQGGTGWVHWYRLTPDAQGNYTTGTWSRRTPSTVGRLYFPSAVLRDGRVLVAGGEYIQGNYSTNTMEIYDPVADSWMRGPDGLYMDIGDTGACLLSDGRFLCSSRDTDLTQIYDPSTNAWTPAGEKATHTTGDEEGWQLMPDGSVLDFLDNPGERYLPSQGKWVSTAQCPFNMTIGGEIGPSILLATGQVLCIAESGKTALYTGPANPTDPGSWTLGPTFPNNYVAGDIPGCNETNGKVLCVASNGLYGQAYFYEYDPSTNAFTAISGPANQTFGASLDLRMLALPNGQILMSDGTQNSWVYTPTGSPNSAWRPTISSITQNPDGSYHLVGTQLNGISTGGSYGDDAMMSSNYPLLRLTATNGTVYYARTFNHSTMGVATGSAAVSTEFRVPAAAPVGTYQVAVVANGISSATGAFNLVATPTSIQVSPSMAPVNQGQTQQFTASVYDQFGKLVSPQPSVTWSVDNGGKGLISSTGLYSAPSTGIGVDTVRATIGGLSGAASAQIVGPGSVVVPDGSFETPSVGLGNYLYNATGGPWTFTNTAGIQSNGSGFGAAAAPDGVQTAFVQGGSAGPLGYFSAAANFISPGTYQVGFMAAARNTQVQPIQVSVDGQAVGGAITPSDSAFHPYSTASFSVATAGQHTITFAATTGTSDATSFVDLVSAYVTPAVATAASANPNPVTATTTNLSVLGSYVPGENQLTYSWSTSGTPPAPVTFSVNGTNAAKYSTATFAAAGSYTLVATISDPGGHTATSSVSVVVNQTGSSISVAPKKAFVGQGQTQQFAATELDQFGNAMVPQPAFTWSLASGATGAISASGVYTAASTGYGPDTVIASAGAISGTATVTNTGPVAATIPDGSFEMPALGLTHYSYNPTGGPWTFVNAAGIQANQSAFVAATAPDGVQTAFLQGGTSQGLGSASVSANFAATGSFQLSFMLAGRNIQVQPIQVSIDGTALGSPISPTDSTFRLYTTPPFNIATTGQHTVSLAATSAASDQTAFVDLVAAQLLPSLATAASANPNPVTGTTTNLSVLGSYGTGEYVLTYTWAAVGAAPAPVTFSVNGTNAAKNTTATFAKVGTYTLQATIADNSGHSTVSSVVVNVVSTLTGVQVAPPTAYLNQGQTQQFTAATVDQFGQPMSSQPSFTWSLGSGATGTLSSSGLYTAATTGFGTDTVRAATGSLTGTAAATNIGPSSVSVPDGSFETPVLAAGSYAYTPTGGPWTFANAGGIESNGSAFAAPAAPDGVQAAFFQALPNAGTASVSASFAASGRYQISFEAARRASQIQPIQVSVDSNAVGGPITPTDSTFRVYTTAPFTVATSGQHTITLAGTVNSSDECTFVDLVSAQALPSVATSAAASPNPVTGTTTNLTVVGGYGSGEYVLTYTWATTGTPPAPVTYSANGTNAAKSTTATFTTPGTYNFQVTIADNSGHSATSSVSVNVVSTATTIVVTPNPVTVQANGSVTFTGSARDQFGTVMSPQPTLAWSVTSGVGAINASTGVYSAPATAGSAVVQAAAGGATGTASVTVTQGAPGAPTGLTAKAGVKSVALAWFAPTNGTVTSYSVKRSTVSGGPYTSVATGLTVLKYTDKAVVNYKTYFYVVTALNGSAESSPSNEASAQPLPKALAYHINSGGPAITGTSWVADKLFTGGTAGSFSTPVTVAGVANAAPSAVYQTERAGATVTYTIRNEPTNHVFTVRLHFSENTYTGTGQRVFTVKVNGVSALTNFDIYKAAGGANIANVQSFSQAPDATGKITIKATASVATAKFSGLEILP